MTVKELITKIGFEVDQQQLTKAETQTKKMSLGMKAAIAGAGVALLAIGKKAIEAAADMEMLTTQFEVMLGSAEEANKMMDDLKKFSASTPFSLKDLSKGTQQLLSFGVASTDVIDTMRMLGDTAGGDTEKLDGLVLAYGKVQTKGKASLEEINMMAERGIPIFDTLSSQMDVSKEEIFKLISAGKISSQDITQSFRTMTSEGGMFFQGMEKQSLTFSGMLSTLKDNITLLLAEMGTLLLPILKEVMGTLTQLLQGDLGESLQALLNPIFAIVGKVLPPLVKIITMITPILKIVGGIIEQILPLLDIILKILDPILDLVNTILTLMFEVVEVQISIVTALIGGVVKVLERILNTALTPILAVVQKIINWVMQFIPFLQNILGVISKVVGVLFEVLSVVMTIAMWLREQLLGLLKRLFDFLFSKVIEFKDWIVGIVTGLFSFIGGLFQKFWGWLLGKFPALGGVIMKIADTFSGVFNIVRESFASMFDWIVDKVNWLIGALNKIPGVDIPMLGGDGGVANIGGEPQQVSNLLGGDIGSAFDVGRTPSSTGATVNMENNVSVTAPAGANTEAIKGAVEQAAQAVFSVQLQKVLTDANY